MFDQRTFATILQDERTRVVKEFNACHNPSGAGGGQFCSKGGGGKLTITNRAPSVSVRKGSDPAKAAFDAIGKHVPGFQPKRGMVAGSTSDPDTPYASADVARGSEHWATRPQDAAKRVKKVRHKVEYPAEGARLNPQHVATYRGMTINTLPSYTTPYYYVDAPGFGSFHHERVFSRIKRQVDTFKTTGATAERAKKQKASEKYQKRKARYGS